MVYLYLPILVNKEVGKQVPCRVAVLSIKPKSADIRTVIYH